MRTSDDSLAHSGRSTVDNDRAGLGPVGCLSATGMNDCASWPGGIRT
jgi:hypothetical protein